MDEVLGSSNGQGNEGAQGALRYKKLAAYLLLLYPSYLKGETSLEPEVKMALWRMAKFDKTFLAKVRIAQLEYLDMDLRTLEADWDPSKDNLFPLRETGAGMQLSPERKKLLMEYKTEILQLLRLAQH